MTSCDDFSSCSALPGRFAELPVKAVKCWMGFSGCSKPWSFECLLLEALLKTRQKANMLLISEKTKSVSHIGPGFLFCSQHIFREKLGVLFLLQKMTTQDELLPSEPLFSPSLLFSGKQGRDAGGQQRPVARSFSCFTSDNALIMWKLQWETSGVFFFGGVLVEMHHHFP